MPVGTRLAGKGVLQLREVLGEQWGSDAEQPQPPPLKCPSFFSFSFQISYSERPLS